MFSEIILIESELIPFVVFVHMVDMFGLPVLFWYSTHNLITQAMRVETDQEIVELIGTSPVVLDHISASFEECATNSVFTSMQALECIPAISFTYTNFLPLVTQPKCLTNCHTPHLHTNMLTIPLTRRRYRR